MTKNTPADPSLRLGRLSFIVRPATNPARMNREQLDRLAFDTKDRMAQFVHPFVTPITRSDNPKYGWAWGSGVYVWIESVGGAFVFTNDHVAAAARSEVLGHLPRPGAEYEAIGNTFHSWPEPIDFACAPIDFFELSDERDCLALDQFDTAYNPVLDELLFWIGFPGTTLRRSDPMNEVKVRYSWGGELYVPGVPVLSQAVHEVPVVAPTRYDPRYHQLIHYPEAAKKELDGPELEMPNPHGLSGSLLWDTKRIACYAAGVEWRPEFARVCGLVWAAGERTPVVIATRVEHVLTCLADLNKSPSP